jgi:hypothetical protein
MDALLAAVVEETALEGRAGCSLETLWTLLSDRLYPVTEELKPYVWRELRAMPRQIQFTTAGLLKPRYSADIGLWDVEGWHEQSYAG